MGPESQRYRGETGHVLRASSYMHRELWGSWPSALPPLVPPMPLHYVTMQDCRHGGPFLAEDNAAATEIGLVYSEMYLTIRRLSL